VKNHRWSLFWGAAWLLGCSTGSHAPIATIPEEVVTTAQINGSNLPDKTVVLTYDDGPDDHTLELAHYLADNGVRATFFVNGRRFCKMDSEGKCTGPQDTRPCNNGQSQAAVASPKYYPESVLDEVLSLGHRVANHTQDHCHLPGETNVADLTWELQTTQTILDRHICDGVFLFRAPFGEWNATVAGRVTSAPGLNKLIGPINWDVDGNDWDCWQKKKTPQACVDGYLAILNGRAKKNGIFLMHDRPEFNVTYEGPLLMAKLLVPKLKADGFKFATMDDVLKMAPRDAGCATPPAADAAPPPSADAGASSEDATPPAPGVDAGEATPGDADPSMPRPDARPSSPPPQGGSGGAAAGSGGGAGEGDEDTGGKTGGSSTGKSGGCAVVTAPASPLPALPLLVALLALRRRRR
jgi:MYXO-CTERM domain-containing protein